MTSHKPIEDIRDRMRALCEVYRVFRGDIDIPIKGGRYINDIALLMDRLDRQVSEDEEEKKFLRDLLSIHKDLRLTPAAEKIPGLPAAYNLIAARLNEIGGDADQ